MIKVFQDDNDPERLFCLFVIRLENIRHTTRTARFVNENGFNVCLCYGCFGSSQRIVVVVFVDEE